jgi:hypothetical protein
MHPISYVDAFDAISRLLRQGWRHGVRSGGSALTYFLKWVPEGRNDTLATGVGYARATDAMEFGCTILAQEPEQIWVEDGRGHRVAVRAEILAHCRRRGLAN